MKLSTVLSTSIVALSLVACGSDNDTAKPDDGKNNLPPKSEECIAAGDKCQLEGDKWVIHEKKDDKEQKDEPPATDSAFDYSDIGVTDELKAEKRGFSFWHKGPLSGLNSKKFAKNKPTQSPTIQWSSSLNYDVDLWNFVAITLDDSDKNEKNKPKYMFDDIGQENQKENANSYMFGYEAFQNATDAELYSGQSSYDYAGKYRWNIVPALVNTFMYRNSHGGWSLFRDPSTKAFLNEEKDTGYATLKYREGTSDKVIPKTTGTGSTKLRVYGVNAFLQSPDNNAIVKKETAEKLIDPSTGIHYSAEQDSSNTPTKENFYKLEIRNSTPYLKHINFAWYKLSTKGKRIQRTTLNSDATAIEHALNKFKKVDNPFPTDIELDQLHYTQFGRLTGQGIDPEADKINGYTDDLLRKYEFTPESLAAAAGNKEAEDWYFARGTEPTPVSTLDNYKTAGNKVVYDGMAVMFGIDYDPRKPKKPTETKNDQSTNSVKPPPGLANDGTLMDGKQNFVRLTWDPSTGDIKGSVYGVWTQVSYWRANKDFGKGGGTWLKKNRVAELTIVNKKLSHDATKDGHEMPKLDKDTYANNNTERVKAEAIMLNHALRIEPFITELVHLEGKVVEGTNGFGGKAIRVKDESTGLFHGGFFGRDGSEVGGVINSQTGNFKDENLADPTSKWGGAFGAKNQKSEVEEDLIFSDKPVDYGTSTEFFTTN